MFENLSLAGGGGIIYCYLFPLKFIYYEYGDTFKFKRYSGSSIGGMLCCLLSMEMPIDEIIIRIMFNNELNNYFDNDGYNPFNNIYSFFYSKFGFYRGKKIEDNLSILIRQCFHKKLVTNNYATFSKEFYEYIAINPYLKHFIQRNVNQMIPLELITLHKSRDTNRDIEHVYEHKDDTYKKVLCDERFLSVDLEKFKKDDYQPTFFDLFVVFGVDLIVSVTNLNTKKIEYLGFNTTPHMPIFEAIRMTMSIPFVFDYKQYGGCIYVDGGILNNYAIDIFYPNSSYYDETNPLKLSINQSYNKTIGLVYNQKKINPPNHNMFSYIENIVEVMYEYQETVISKFLTDTNSSPYSVFKKFVKDHTLIVDYSSHISLLNFNLSLKQQQEIIFFSLFDCLVFLKPIFFISLFENFDVTTSEEFKNKVCAQCLINVQYLFETLESDSIHSILLDTKLLLHCLMSAIIICL